jgi:DNA-binding LacI/PurR family transcriptional regulator
MPRRQPLATIDNDIRQVVEELAELLRRSAGAYPTPQQRIRLKHLTARRTLLARVIMQRNKEHQEATQ